jgi:hypothetical protein
MTKLKAFKYDLNYKFLNNLIPVFLYCTIGHRLTKVWPNIFFAGLGKNASTFFSNFHLQAAYKNLSMQDVVQYVR